MRRKVLTCVACGVPMGAPPCTHVWNGKFLCAVCREPYTGPVLDDIGPICWPCVRSKRALEPNPL